MKYCRIHLCIYLSFVNIFPDGLFLRDGSQMCTNIDSNKLISGRMVKLAPTGKQLVSLLNEQNPHCYIHSTHYFPYFISLCYRTVFCCRSVTLNNNNNKKKVWGEYKTHKTGRKLIFFKCMHILLKQTHRCTGRK